MKRLAVLATFAVFGVSAAGCQIYDFQVVSQGTLSQTEESFPLTPALKPNLWLLVDRSGSMSTPDLCTGGSCQTRLQALQSAMSTFLTDPKTSTIARMGLTFFPAPQGEGACTPAHQNAVELPDPTLDDDPSYNGVLSAKASSINDAIQKVPLSGGTPTGLSVRFVGNQPGLMNPDDRRDDFILLLTDGLPNCNSENIFGTCSCVSASSNTCTDALKASCRCTSKSSPYCLTSSTCQGCLDQAASAAEIAAVKSKGIRTIVLAFVAPDLTTGDGPETLAAMATAGGGNFRTCAADATCGPGDHCVLPPGGGTGLCHRQYYMANNASELGDMLAQISGSLRVDPCTFPLTQGLPDSSKTVAVIVSGEDVRPGPTTWSYSGNSVVFAKDGQYCKDIIAQKQGMTLKVRYVSTL